MTKLTLKERLVQKKKERAYLKKLEELDSVDGYDIRVSVDLDDWDAYIGEKNLSVFHKLCHTSVSRLEIYYLILALWINNKV